MGILTKINFMHGVEAVHILLPLQVKFIPHKREKNGIIRDENKSKY